MSELHSHLYTCAAGILSLDSSENENDLPSQIQSSTNSTSQMDNNSEKHTITLWEILEQPLINAGQQLTSSAQPEQPTSSSENHANTEQHSMNAETSNSAIASQETNLNSPHQNIIANSPIRVEGDTHGPMDMNKLNYIVDKVVEQCKKSDVINNKETLRVLQSKILQGRSLDIGRKDACLEGETSYIYVNRDNLLGTAMDEIATIENIFLTL